MNVQLSAGSAEAVVAKITALVEDIQRKGGSMRPLAPSDSLTDAGVTSLDMVNLMLATEAAFDIFIPAELINPTSFRSIQSIANLVESLLSEPAPKQDLNGG